MLLRYSRISASVSGLPGLICSLLPVLFFVLASCSSENTASLQIGDKAPAFTVRDLEGKNISLSDYAGSPVIIRFFLTDCKFCRADTPILEEYYTRHAEKGLHVLYIDTLGVEPKRLRSFADEFELTFPVAQDIGGKTASSYMVRALPQTIVLDPGHKIIAAILGGVSEPELNSLLASFLE